MAIYHLSAKPIQRSKGESAVAAAAYRAGEKLHDARRDQMEDYSRRHGVVHSEIITPDNAPDWMKNREELWNKAEAAEKRKDAQPAREVRLALPEELTDEQRAALVHAYCHDAFVSRGMVADYSIHRPDRHGDERNHHAHVLLTMREIDGDGFSAKKNTDWNKVALLEDWREQWAEYQNRVLEDAGSDARVDHQTLEAQGIDRVPTEHLGHEAAAMERRGEQTRRGDRNREIAQDNQDLDRLRSERAEVDVAIAWEQVSTLVEPEASSFPTAQPEEIQDTSLSDRLPYIREQEANIREHGKVAERGNESMLVEIAALAEMYADLEEGEYKPEAGAIGKEDREDTSLSDRLPYIQALEQQIRESGEVTQRGGLGNWYGKTADLAARAYDYVRDYVSEVVETVKGYWQQREEARREQEEEREQDKGMDMDIGDW